MELQGSSGPSSNHTLAPSLKRIHSLGTHSDPLKYWSQDVNHLKDLSDLQRVSVYEGHIHDVLEQKRTDFLEPILNVDSTLHGVTHILSLKMPTLPVFQCVVEPAGEDACEIFKNFASRCLKMFIIKK